MWRPENSIRYQIPETRWPTAEEAGASLLFAPIRVGRLSLESRTWVPAMVPWRATEEGFVTQNILDWYGRFAEGRPGAIVVEATGVRDIPSGPLLRIGHDRFIPGLTKLVETVRQASGGHTRLFIQIIDFLKIRRRPEPERYLGEFLAITDRHRALISGTDPEIRSALTAMSETDLRDLLTPREFDALMYGERELVTDVDLPHIRDLPQVLPEVFAAAARRAERSGFDGVELHYAHAYTLASFLSALNNRDDGYGGTRVNRARLPIEVYQAVRGAVTSRFVVGCRFLTEECIPGDNSAGDSAWLGVEFARAGMDYLSLSRGGKFEDAKQPRIGWARYPYTGRSGYECMPTVRSDELGPFGRNREATHAVREAVRGAGCETPVVMSGGISTFEQAEDLLRTGVADIIASARQSLADPDWFRKLRLGLGDEVRRCVFTNYCEGLEQVHKPVTCKLWDHLEIEGDDTPRTDDGRRRMVAPAWAPAHRC